jgi:hypothetical protein
LLVGALVGAQAAGASPRNAQRAAHAAAVPVITISPALQPAFNPAIPNYVTRCEPGDQVKVDVSNVTRAGISIDGQPGRTGKFSATVPLVPGQRFTIRITTAAGVASYNVRCLPPNFPQFTAQVSGQVQAAYYLVTPGTGNVKAPEAPFVALFDRNGVPVWWYDDTNGTPVDANVLSGGNLSWDVENNMLALAPVTPTWQVSQGFGVPSGVDLVERRLNGTLVHTLDTVGSPTDFHEGLQLGNGDFLMTSYALRGPASLAPVFLAPATVLDATFQEITPAGALVHTWDEAGKIPVADSAPWWTSFTTFYPNLPGTVVDYQHVDSVTPDGNSFLISLRDTNAIYLVSATDGSVQWKLGGTPTPQSLAIAGVPNAQTEFGGQSDARVWPDGTISVYDNGLSHHRPPRVLRFRIDPVTRTATLVQTIADPTVAASPCCGSARLLPRGDWVVDWGGTQTVEELTAFSRPVLRLTFAYPYTTYRAVPVLPGQLSAGAIQAGMDKMNPHTPSGSQAPPLTRLHASVIDKKLEVSFTLGWHAPVKFTIDRRVDGPRCAALAAANQAPHTCARLIGLGSVTYAGVAGPNRLVLGGALAGRVTVLSRYTLTATPLSRRHAGPSEKADFRVTG